MLRNLARGQKPSLAVVMGLGQHSILPLGAISALTWPRGLGCLEERLAQVLEP